MYQRIKIQEEYALRPEGDGGCQQCDRDQGIEGEDVGEAVPRMDDDGRHIDVVVLK